MPTPANAVILARLVRAYGGDQVPGEPGPDAAPASP